MSGHVHADLMAQYAEDAKKTENPWERWEVKGEKQWVDCLTHPKWNPFYEYRRKPKTSEERFQDFMRTLPRSTEFVYGRSDMRAAFMEGERQARELDE